MGRRKNARIDAGELPGTIVHDGQQVPCSILNLSIDGAALALASVPDLDITPGSRFSIVPDRVSFSGTPEFIVRHVTRRAGRILLGAQATDETTRAYLWRLSDTLGHNDRSVPDAAGDVLADAGVLQTVPGRGHYDEPARQRRLAWSHDVFGVHLTSVARTELPAETLKKNVENFVGTVEVPIGLAGPLRFAGATVVGDIVAPFATTEGTLVASATRGAVAISRSGGVSVHLLKQSMTRAPVFETRDAGQANMLGRWLRSQLPEMRAEIANVSRHARLVQVDPVQMGKDVYANFVYETEDAAGQNMTTAATWALCKWVKVRVEALEAIEITDILLESNLSGDKKVGHRNFVIGRGASVVAECFLADAVIERTLKTTSDAMLRADARGRLGSLCASLVGHNYNAANAVAALFTATGQDIACVHESSLATFETRKSEGGLYASMTMPSIVVGTIGGGTHLPAQRECIALLGCDKPYGAARLAQIIAGFALALDLSTLAAVTAGQFAAAHERLGRNRPERAFSHQDLTADFFNRAGHGRQSLATSVVEGVETARDLGMGDSIVSTLAEMKSHHLVGLTPMRVHVRRDDGSAQTVEMVIKAKARGAEMNLWLASAATMVDGQLGKLFETHVEKLHFTNSCERELFLYEADDVRLDGLRPNCYFTYRDPERDAFIVAMEYVQATGEHRAQGAMGTLSREAIETAIRAASKFHAIYYGNTDPLKDAVWLRDVRRAEDGIRMRPLWSALVHYAEVHSSSYLDQTDIALLHRVVERVELWWPVIDAGPQTLIHNDFNSRNLLFTTQADGSLGVRAVDWELATLHLPQRDLCELLSFALGEEDCSDVTTIQHFSELHRRSLEQEAGCAIDRQRWNLGLGAALQEFIVTRLGLYQMYQAIRVYEPLPRVVRSALAMLRGLDWEQQVRG